MQKQKTRVYKFPVGAAVIINNGLSQYNNIRGKIYSIHDPALTPAALRDHLEEDRAPVTGEVQYSVLIKNTKSKAQWLQEDPDNEAENFPEYEVVSDFYQSDLRRDGF